MSRVNPDDYFGAAEGDSQAADPPRPRRRSTNPDDYFGPVSAPAPAPEPPKGMLDRAGDAVEAAVEFSKDKGTTRPDPFGMSARPMGAIDLRSQGEKLEAPPKEAPEQGPLIESRGAPVSKEAFDSIKVRLAAMTPDERRRMLARTDLPSWMRDTMAQAAAEIERDDRAFQSTGVMSPTASGATRQQRLISSGMDPQAAGNLARSEATRGGVPPLPGAATPIESPMSLEQEAQAEAEGEQMQRRSIAARGLYAGSKGLDQAGYGAMAAVLHAVGDKEGAKVYEAQAAMEAKRAEAASQLDAMRKQAEEMGVMAASPAAYLERMSVGGMNSVAQMLPGMALGSLVALGTGNPVAGAAVARTIMSSQVFAQEFVNPEAVSKLSPAERAGRASIYASLEYIGERYGLLPQAMKALVGRANAVPLEELPAWAERAVMAMEKRGLFSKALTPYVKGQAGEQIGEQITGAGQYLVDGTPLGLDGQVSVRGFLENARDVAVQTFVATSVMQAGGAAVGGLIGSRGGRDEPPEDEQPPPPDFGQRPGVTPQIPVTPTVAGRKDDQPLSADDLLGSPLDEKAEDHSLPHQPGDMTTGDGMPYGSRAGAQARANKDGGRVVPVLGGWVVRAADKAGQPENASNGLAAGADGPGNPRLAPASGVQRLDALGVDGKAVVKGRVLSVLQDQQVLRSVVELVPVDVMDVLVGEKITPKSLLGNPSVLLERLAAAFDDPVRAPAISLLIDAVAAGHPDAFAGLPTEVQAALGMGGAPSVNPKLGPASGAANIGSHSGNDTHGIDNGNKPDLAVPAAQPQGSADGGVLVAGGGIGTLGSAPGVASGGVAPAAPAPAAGPAEDAGLPGETVDGGDAASLSDAPDFVRSFPKPDVESLNAAGRSSAFDGLDGQYLVDAIEAMHRDVAADIGMRTTGVRAMRDAIAAGTTLDGKPATEDQLKAMQRELQGLIDTVNGFIQEYESEFGRKHAEAFRKFAAPDWDALTKPALTKVKPAATTQAAKDADDALRDLGTLLGKNPPAGAPESGPAPASRSDQPATASPAQPAPDRPWLGSPFEARIDKMLADLEQAGGQEMAKAISSGIAIDIRGGRLSEEDVSYRETVARREIARLAKAGKPAQPTTWTAETADTVAASDRATAALPRPILEAAANRLNELGSQLAQLGFASDSEVRGDAPQSAIDIARQMREVRGSLMSLASRRYQHAKGHKTLKPGKLDRDEDFASRVLNFDTRTHPGVDTTDVITQSGARERAAKTQKKAKGVSTHPKTVWGSRLLAEISRQKKGINPELLHDLSFRKQLGTDGKGNPRYVWFNPPVAGIRKGLFRDGGIGDMVELAEWMEEEGYLEPGSVERDYKEASERAMQLVKDALNRKEAQTIQEIADEAQADREEEADAWYAGIDQEAAEELEAERLAIMAENEVSAAEMDALDDVDIDFESPAGASGYDAMRASGLFTEEEIADAIAQDEAAAAEERAAQAGADGADGAREAAEDREAQAQREERRERVDEILSSYDEDELRRRQQSQEAQIAADNKVERDKMRQAAKDREDRENKARADATVDDFQLGQSAEQQMSGMDDLFSRPETPPAEVPAEVPAVAAPAAQPADAAPGTAIVAGDAMARLNATMRRAGWEIDYVDVDLTGEKPRATIRITRNDGRWIFAKVDGIGRASFESFQRDKSLGIVKDNPQARVAPLIDDIFLGRQKFDSASAMLRGMVSYLVDNATGTTNLVDMRSAWAGVMGAPTRFDALESPAEVPAEVRPSEEEARNAALRQRIRDYWLNTAYPALREYGIAFDRFTAERLERHRIKPEGMTAAQWLEKWRTQQSKWDGGRKIQDTGIQALSQKGLWPTDDGRGEELRKALLAAVKALKNAPGWSGGWIENAINGSNDIFAENAQPAEAPADPRTAYREELGRRAEALGMSPGVSADLGWFIKLGELGVGKTQYTVSVRFVRNGDQLGGQVTTSFTHVDPVNGRPAVQAPPQSDAIYGPVDDVIAEVKARIDRIRGSTIEMSPAWPVPGSKGQALNVDEQLKSSRQHPDFGENFSALDGRQVAQTMTTTDGRQATLRFDAAKVMRELDDRQSSLEALLKCLEKVS